RTFVSVFAPDFPKGEIDFDKRSFDYRDPLHVAYAKRDAECLFHAMRRAFTVVKEITGHNLCATAGALAIRSFMSEMPKGIQVPALGCGTFDIVRKCVMRGGYV